MRIIFAGTPAFAAAALRRIHDAGHDVALVLAQPDRPAGRGMQSHHGPTAAVAIERNLPLFQPLTLKDEGVQARLREAGAEVMVVAAYGLLLPADVLGIPPRGCLNIHASLLPRWRGAAPIQRAIEAGDAETGICIMRMEKGLDTGPVLLEKRISILPADTTSTLLARLTDCGSEAIVEALAHLHELVPAKQDDGHATYARKISRDEAPIQWEQPANAIERRLRAFDPFPGCETRLDGATLKIWKAATSGAQTGAAPGTIIALDATSIEVQCGQGSLRLIEVQKPGGRRMSIRDYLPGANLRRGQVLG